jgi:hypothetical protein
MRYFNNLRIKNKTLVSFGVIFVLAIGLGFYVINRLSFIGTRVDNIEQNVSILPPLAEINGDAARLQALAGEMILADSNAIPGIAAEEDAIRKGYQSEWDKYRPTMDAGAETSYGNQFNDAFNRLSDGARRVGQAVFGNETSLAESILTGDMRQAAEAFHDGIEKDLAYQSVQSV